MEIKAFSRAKVDAIHDHGFFLKGWILQAMTSGSTLSDQLIDILVGTAFSGNIRDERNRNPQTMPGRFQVGSEFFTVIGGDTFKMSHPF